MSITFNPSSLLNGNGIDVTSVVKQILDQKSGQLTLWQNQQTTLQGQAGVLDLINDHLDTLASAVTALSDPLGVLTSQAANSSNTGIVTASAQSTATTANHTIVVSNLASIGILYTDPVAAGADASILPQGATGGTLQLQIGGQSGKSAQVQITAGSNDTLNSLAKSINDQSTQNNWGITASVITDATGARLSVSSTATGTSGAITLTSNDTVLNFNPPVGGANASLTIDGIPYSSTTNSISGAIAGVTLNLFSASPGTSVQVAVGADSAGILQAINNFVNAYNQIIQDMNLQFKINPATNSQGILGSDTGLRSLQASLLRDITYSVEGNSGVTNLAALGINMNDDGTLTVGSTPSGQTIDQVLSQNPQAFFNFFQNATTTGFADAFHKDLINLTDTTNGLLNIDLAQNSALQRSVADSIANLQDQLAAQQKQLTDQFNRVNAALQAYPMLLQQVTKTLEVLSPLTNSSK